MTAWSILSHMQSCRVYEHLEKKNQFINLSNHQLVTNLQYWHCEHLLILAAVYCVLYSALCTGLRNAWTRQVVPLKEIMHIAEFSNLSKLWLQAWHFFSYSEGWCIASLDFKLLLLQIKQLLFTFPSNDFMLEGWKKNTQAVFIVAAYLFFKEWSSETAETDLKEGRLEM